MMTCCWRPTPVSDSSSWTSSSRHGAPLMAYSLSPERNRVRVMVISARSVASLPALLSMVRVTSARPSAGREAVPTKMTSSILEERTVLGPWAPSTQATASTTLDLPLPLGPTTTVMPGSNSSTAASAKDLKPLRERDFRNTGRSPYRHWRGGREVEQKGQEGGGGETWRRTWRSDVAWRRDVAERSLVTPD